MAVVDYFLKIEGVEGESQDSKHKDEIQVLSWSLGEQQAGTMAFGGGGAGTGAKPGDSGASRIFRPRDGVPGGRPVRWTNRYPIPPPAPFPPTGWTTTPPPSSTGSPTRTCRPAGAGTPPGSSNRR